MDDAVVVKKHQPLEDLRHHSLERPLTALPAEVSREVDPVDGVHREVEAFIVLAELVHAHEIGVNEPLDGAKLELEPHECRRLRSANALSRDLPPNDLVEHEIDAPHGALAEGAERAIAWL